MGYTILICNRHKAYELDTGNVIRSGGEKKVDQCIRMR